MTKQEQNALYEDIVFSHDSYSAIIFDGMYELLEKTLSFKHTNIQILEQYGITTEYRNGLRNSANKTKHTMNIQEFIITHNRFIEPFNQLLMHVYNQQPIDLYKIESYEYAPKELNLSRVIQLFHIIKLYEQFSIMYINHHPRALLRLQMFFESSIRLHASEYDKTFVHMINSHETMKNFVSHLFDTTISVSQQKAFVSNMMDLNNVRNNIKKRSDYDQSLQIASLERYAMLIAQKLEASIKPYDKPIFTSTQALLEYKNAFRELSFDYRYQVYSNLKDAVFTEEIAAIHQNDLAYQVYIIQTLMGGQTMKQINDFEKIFETINQFEEVVDHLSKINERYSDVKETFDKVTDDIVNFKEINKKMAILSQVDFQKLSAFINVQDEFTDGLKLSQVLQKFKERTDDIKDINQQIKELKKSIQLLQNKIDKELA